MSHVALVVNSPYAVAEVIDGELVVMNLALGTYYSSRGTGATVWQWIANGIQVEDLRAVACASFDAPEGVVLKDLDAFVTHLKEEELIREQASDTSDPAPSAVADRLPYSAPQLEVYSDMEDLLLLDPIHEVAEEEGWPVRPTEFPSKKAAQG